MKRLFIILIFTSICGITSAQELSLGVDLFNRYVWRGLDLGGKSPSVQPWANIKFSNENHSLTFGTWGAFSIAGTANEETDLYLNYAYKSCINLLVTDYFFPGLNSGAKENYFEWNADSTGHVLEGTVSFSGTDNIPFTALFAMNFYGNDARRSNGDLFLSKYVEIGYKRTIRTVALNVFMGAALDDPDTQAGETGYYLNDKTTINNIGVKLSKSVQITDTYALQIQCSLMTNPNLKKVFLTVGFSI